MTEQEVEKMLKEKQERYLRERSANPDLVEGITLDDDDEAALDKQWAKEGERLKEESNG